MVVGTGENIVVVEEKVVEMDEGMVGVEEVVVVYLCGSCQKAVANSPRS